VDAYLSAWRKRAESPTQAVEARRRFLSLYAQAYRDLTTEAAVSDYDRRLRLLWDLCGVVHATTIPPGDVKQALGWQEPRVADASPGPPAAMAEARDRPLRTRPDRVPTLVLQLLQSLPVDPSGGATFADFVSTNVREVYLTPQLVEWSPVCSMDVCGSCEPLTRTLILVSAGYVDLAPPAAWSLAAVAVHETAHIEWFHRPEVSRDPRLLLPTPNERNAWRLMVRFLRGLLRERPQTVQSHVRTNAAAIRKMLQRARKELQKANRALHLPVDDESLHLELPPGIDEADLKGDRAALPAP